MPEPATPPSRARTRVRLGAALTGALVVAALSATPATAADSPLEIFLSRTNEYRAQHGLAPLHLNTSMSKVAQTWSASMLKSRSLSHNPSYASQIPAGWSRAAENVGYACRYGGATANAAVIMNGWLKSTGHARNLRGDHTEIGLGFAYDAATDCAYATQNLAKYSTSPSTFSIVGTIAPPSGKAMSTLKGATVVASGGGTTRSATVSPTTGEYVLTGLPSGSYTLLITPAASGITKEYHRDAASTRCASRTTVGKRDLVDLDARLGTGSLASPSRTLELCDVSGNAQSRYYSVFAKQIGWLADEGISTGWANGRGAREFRPLQRVNRDVMAAFLYRLAGEPAVSADRAAFDDVAAKSSFATEIAWLASSEISTGWETETGHDFRPLAPVNRDQLAAFLYRMAGEPEVTLPARSPFADVPRTHVFYKEISWMASTGISTGWEVGSRVEFRPDAPVTREQMAAFLSRYDAKN